MSTDEISVDQISTMQLSDSFFPTGMYTTSNGLEWLFYQKRIKNPNELRDLIAVYVEHQMGPADCAAIGNAYDAAQNSDIQKLIDVDQTIFSMKLIEEIRSASTRSGVQLLRCVASFVNDNEIMSKYQECIKNGQAAGIFPVSLAVACSLLGIPKKRAGLMMLYGFTVSVVGAGLRLGMLQHFDGQRVIHELRPVILETVKKNIDRPITSMWQFAPEVDIFQISHERMSSKMFIT
jgi:urease accessory protein